MTRDYGARLKMCGALLRLDALFPDGFTRHQLAELADVAEETARDFVKADRAPQYVEPVGHVASGGRPLIRYRLTSSGRSDLLRYIAQTRRQLDAEKGEKAPTNAELFAPLDLLEKTVLQLGLDAKEGRDDEWREHREEALLELAGCKADLRALQERRSPIAEEYGRRLTKAELELGVTRPPPAVPAYAPMDPLGEVVRRFGAWVLGVPPRLQPLVILFKGGAETVANEVVQACSQADVRVASFNVAAMAKSDRTLLYGLLDRLRVTTPLAVCDFVLAVDGGSFLAQELATEFNALGSQPGQWSEKLAFLPGDFMRVDTGDIRRAYLDKCTSMLSASTVSDARQQTFARRCTSALLALETAETTFAAANVVVGSVQDHRTRWLNSAHGLMGDMICIDSSYHPPLKNTFEGQPVDYAVTAATAWGTSLQSNDLGFLTQRLSLLTR